MSCILPFLGSLNSNIPPSKKLYEQQVNAFSARPTPKSPKRGNSGENRLQQLKLIIHCILFSK